MEKNNKELTKRVVLYHKWSKTKKNNMSDDRNRTQMQHAKEKNKRKIKRM